MINYFSYDDPPPPQGDEPFSVRVEIAGCPWTPQHRLARVALKGKEIDQAHRPPSNLVFLLDVSGSMADDNKLPLLKAAMRLLVDTLGENDRVAIVVYAGRSGLALPSTNGLQKAKILEAIDQLAAGGSTNGGAGIQLAYEQAVGHFIPGGTNRVILATDGDFNVGVTDESALIRMAEQKAKSGVFLSVLGFGEGNLKERTMEQMADKGNGNYYYIDSLDEARKVLVEQAGGTLVTIAKDVKIQVEFQPEQVARYRLIGYENRLMREEDFRDDTKDAGEIGAGHNVTALYELVPAQPNRLLFAGRAIREAKEKVAARAPVRRPSFTVFLRYKPPQGDTAKEIQRVAVDDGRPFPQASPDFQFAAAVAAFGMLLRDAPDKGRLTYDGVYELAAGSRGSDPSGYRSEFLDLVRRAKAITRAP
jgi:Ca-activated chloride channel family protein